MIERKPLAPNNRRLKSAFAVTRASLIRYPKNGERQSVFAYARAGRQNSEGFGGGNRITKLG